MIRKNISKKLRFEVFEHNNFTCQYCGKSPLKHNCVLQVDHIISVKNGGTNDRENLITSCFDCNIGKKAKSVILPQIPDKELELEKTKERLSQVIAINKFQEKINKINQKIELAKYKKLEPLIVDLDDKLQTKIKKAFDKNLDIIGIYVFIKGLELAKEKTEYIDDFMKFLNGYLKQKRLEIENPELALYNKEINFLIYKMDSTYNYLNKGLVRSYIQDLGLDLVKECFENGYNWTAFKQNIFEKYDNAR